MLRGALQNTEVFKMFMQTQMWIWKRERLKKDGSSYAKPRIEICQVQGSLRECGFVYEYVMPEECLAELLTILDLNSNHKQLSGLKAFAIRKMLGNGVKPVPKTKPVITHKFVQQIGIHLYPIGIKYDDRKRRDFKEEGYWEQEMV